MTRNVKLFTSFELRELEIRNRVFVSPMCQYSSEDGMPSDWHLVHLGSRAVGGAGLVMVEASAVSPEGRISPGDSGIWSDNHSKAFAPITKFIKAQGAVAAIQLAHAGRKASTSAPWLGGGPLTVDEGAWQTMGPSPVAFDAGYNVPNEMTRSDMDLVTQEFKQATTRSIEAGFQVIEIHMAHGYLLHSFLSPLSNTRTDNFGGSLENRMRLPLEITRAVRKLMPEGMPLFVRISATDWVDGGWDIQQSVTLAKELKNLGVDLIDCSSGGGVATAAIPVGAGYQVSLAAAVRADADIPTGAVGLITQSFQAETILATGQADAVFLARELLRDPYWPLHAAKELGASGPGVVWPVQYERAVN